MARLQILELPEGSGDDQPPFVLVIDQADEATVESLHRQATGHVDDPAMYNPIADQIGARAVLVFEETIDIPANDTTAYLRDDVRNEVTAKLGDHDVRSAIATDMQKMRDAQAEATNVRDKDGARAEDVAVRLYGVVTASTPDRRAGFSGWALNSDTERSPEE
jgi:hypothetical protein